MAETAIAKIAEYIRDIVYRVEKLEQKQKQFDSYIRASVNIDLNTDLYEKSKDMCEEISKLIKKAFEPEKPLYHRGQEVEILEGGDWQAGVYIKPRGGHWPHVVYMDKDDCTFWLNDEDIRPKHTTEG